MADGTRMQQRRATEAVWITSNYVLAAGELGVTTDTGIIKIGNGTSPWTELDIAFENLYLPLSGTATNSELLGGLSSDTFVKQFDAVSTVTNDAVARRTSTGTLKAAMATASDDLTTKAQMEEAIRSPIVRTVTSAASLALTDVNSIIFVDHSSITTQVVISIPDNATVAFPIGSRLEVTAIGVGGAKITPVAGVTLNGDSNAFPGHGTVRLIKTGTNTWFGLSMNTGKKRPMIRAFRNAGTTYDAGVLTAIPWNSVDGTSSTYNPDNEWFSIPATGLPVARRIIVNKAGHYLVAANFLTTATALGALVIATLPFDNVLGFYFVNAPCFATGTVTIPIRLNAGQAIGVAYSAPAGGASDLADGTFDNRNDFIITRMGD
jgi:hypothetical protein